QRTPHGGNAYSGISLFNHDNANYGDYTEYIQARLVKKLERNMDYCVTFYVSTIIADTSRWETFTTDAIGASLTEFPYDFHDNATIYNWKLTAAPQIKNPVGRYIMPADGWVKISGIYRAQGNEAYITIGNFTKVDSTPLMQLTFANIASVKAVYFYVDDVSVIRVESMKDTLTCRADLPLLQLTPDTALSGYVWSTGETTSVITPPDSGLYWVEYDPGCVVFRDSVKVSVLDAPQIALPPDTFICAGDVLQVAAAASGGKVDNYNWNYGATTQVVNFDMGGRFILNATNRCGTATDSINIDLRDKPQVLLPAEVNLCVEEQLTSITISSSLPLADYTWSTGETSSQITITAPGQYWLSSQNECGVTRRYIEAIGCPPPFASIFIPNVFSPNGDGNNDVWTLYGDSIRVNSIMVFNRWGEKVFDTDSNQGWDGSYKGALQSPGVYVYYIKCSDLLTTEPRHYRGSLTLVR
ncbi:MAG TPA: gliding motility-associated C-terminal domain-containing protein, partial [Chitinophagales bacterium]|nr:gliding motility-associated C-terminal domain-containing protein [Chitinophagales bacterium]